MMKILKCMPWFKEWTSRDINDFLCSLAFVIMFMALMYLIIYIAY